jgi:prophage regulatory protein
MRMNQTSDIGGQPLDPNERIVREAECKQRSGLSRTTRWRLEKAGKFPKRRRISDNGVGWVSSELFEWMRTRPK